MLLQDPKTVLELVGHRDKGTRSNSSSMIKHDGLVTNDNF